MSELPRYYAYEGSGRWYVQDRASGFDMPRRMTTSVSPGLSDAEANIIAFALNAVAEGFKIHLYRDEPTDVRGHFHVTHKVYDGPTEGVAP